MEIGQLYKLTKVAARDTFNKPEGKGKRRDCDARPRIVLDEKSSDNKAQ